MEALDDVFIQNCITEMFCNETSPDMTQHDMSKDLATLQLAWRIFTVKRARHSPGGVGDVDASQVDALAAHDEERGKAEERHAAADHGQLGRLPGAQLQLLDDVAPQHDAHAGAGHDDHTCGETPVEVLLVSATLLKTPTCHVFREREERLNINVTPVK